MFVDEELLLWARRGRTELGKDNDLKGGKEVYL